MGREGGCLRNRTLSPWGGRLSAQRSLLSTHPGIPPGYTPLYTPGYTTRLYTPVTHPGIHHGTPVTHPGIHHGIHTTVTHPGILQGIYTTVTHPGIPQGISHTPGYTSGYISHTRVYLRDERLLPPGYTSGMRNCYNLGIPPGYTSLYMPPSPPVCRCHSLLLSLIIPVSLLVSTSASCLSPVSLLGWVLRGLSFTRFTVGLGEQKPLLSPVSLLG